jgi:uncharacterized SAM-binding protein YcdF (DUF218 family)
MLGGAVDTHITAERGQATLNEAGERVTTMAELSRRFPQARLLLSGGANHVLTSQPVTESAVARDLLIGLGVDPARIEMEERSRDTCENAEQGMMLAKPQPGEQWLLVTSASHMPRAVACFRAAGFPIIPYPVDFRTRGPADLRRPVDRLGILSAASSYRRVVPRAMIRRSRGNPDGRSRVSTESPVLREAYNPPQIISHWAISVLCVVAFPTTEAIRKAPLTINQ